jgi:hypothetical protein
VCKDGAAVWNGTIGWPEGPRLEKFPPSYSGHETPEMTREEKKQKEIQTTGTAQA